MRTAFFIFSIFFISATQSQTIQKYYDYQWKETDAANARFLGVLKYTDSGWHRRDYFLHETNNLQMDGTYLDSSCKVPHGFFYYFYANKNLKSIGKYLNGKKEGWWLSYHNNGVMSDSTFYEDGLLAVSSMGWYPNGFLADSNIVNAQIRTAFNWFDNGHLSSAGRYNSLGRMIGKWQFFYPSDKLASLESYDETGHLIDKTYFDENGNSMDTTNRTKPAEFPGGLKAWQKYLDSKMYFPNQYKIANSDKAVVVINFTISEDGSVEDVFVETPFYEPFNVIALNVIKRSPKWNPAFLHNRNVKFHHRQAIVFNQINE